MSWYAHTGPRRLQPGKFQSQLRIGTEKTESTQYRGWYYSFVAHQTGGGVKRVRYSVSICDPKKNRVKYIRDCSSIGQATDAAKQWIDSTLSNIQLRRDSAAVDVIAPPPTRLFRAGWAQEK